MLNRIGGFAGSMAGRIFAVLVVGVMAAALVASVLAGLQHRADVAAERADRIVDRVETALVTTGPLPGVQRLPLWPLGTPATRLTQRLAARVQGWRDIAVETVDAGNCRPAPPLSAPAAPVPPEPPVPAVHPPPVPPMPNCFAVRLVDAQGTEIVLAIDTPPTPKLVDDRFSPAFLGALSIAALLLALVVSRMAARPISRLGIAAQRLAADLDAAPLPLAGPSDVRRTIAAFNDMQVELRRTLDERTHMLAAISHDLRSPLTRLRLRLDAVGDPVLREKLVGDARHMAALIEEGLDLARLAHSGEAFARVDVTALLLSLCEDAQDIGRPVTCEVLPRMIVDTRPEALRRIMTNLIENALIYGYEAEIGAQIDDLGLCITVSDRGPGIPADALGQVFEPFYRLDTARPSGEGTGLGLTIARLLARQIGGSIDLENRACGGLVATVWIASDRISIPG